MQPGNRTSVHIYWSGTNYWNCFATEVGKRKFNRVEHLLRHIYRLLSRIFVHRQKDHTFVGESVKWSHQKISVYKMSRGNGALLCCASAQESHCFAVLERALAVFAKGGLHQPRLLLERVVAMTQSTNQAGS